LKLSVRIIFPDAQDMIVPVGQFPDLKLKF